MGNVFICVSFLGCLPRQRTAAGAPQKGPPDGEGDAPRFRVELLEVSRMGPSNASGVNYGLEMSQKLQVGIVPPLG